jgi:hypothetical protein
MSHLFQRPLCDMGRAFDFAFRPLVGEIDPSSGGGCDERPHRVELYAAGTDPRTRPDEYRAFALCTEHEGQLRGYDARLVQGGSPSRFRAGGGAPGRA